MSKYDWLDSSSDIMDALDAAESRAYSAEVALAEAAETGMVHPADDKHSLGDIFKGMLHRAEGMAAAGGWAYAAYTIFSEKDDNGKEVPHMPSLFGLNADFLSGLALTASAFFGKPLGFLPWKIPVEALPHLDRLGQGSLDHWAVVAAQRAGAASIGIDIRNKVGGDRVGAANDSREMAQQDSPPSAVIDEKDDPTKHMSPDQARRWHQFRPRASRKAA
jgi:hypothetical protein